MYWTKPAKVEVGKVHGDVALYDRDEGMVFDSDNPAQMQELWDQIRSFILEHKLGFRCYVRDLDSKNSKWTYQDVPKMDKLLKSGDYRFIVSENPNFHDPQFEIVNIHFKSGNIEVPLKFS